MADAQETAETGDIERIGKFIASGGFEVLLHTRGEQGEVEEVLASLGEDHAGRRYVLQLFFISDIANAIGLDQDDDLDTAILQFFMVLPFEIDAAAREEAVRMAHLVSKIQPIGHIVVDEADGVYQLSYRLVLPDRSPEPQVIQDVVGMIGFGLAAYGGALDEAGTGRTTARAFSEGLAAHGFDLLALGTAPPPADQS